MTQPQPVYVRGGAFPWRLLFLVIAVVLFGIAALLFFGTLTDASATNDGLGLVAAGLAAFAIAHI